MACTNCSTLLWYYWQNSEIVFDNFFVLFTVVELGFSKESKAKHQLLWKQHVVKTYDLDKPAERTLFVVNVPPYVTEVRVSC